MILESVENDPLIWPSVEENGVTRPKKYSELSATEAIQADCDVNVTKIILQGLPPEVYALDRNHKVAKELWERIQLLMQGTSLTKQERECLTVPVFKQSDDPIDAINHMMSFLSTVVTSRYPTTNNQLRNSSNPRQQATIHDGRITLQPILGRDISFASGEGHMSKQCTKPKRKRDDSWFKDKVLLVQAQANGQILHEEELAFLADPGIAEVALMANLSHYGSDALAEVHNHDNVDTNLINQIVQAMSSSEQSNIVNHPETEITSDSNIILYSQYVSEPQQPSAQNSNSSAQQDALILSVIEQLKTQVVNCTKINLDNKSIDDTLTAELERYKEQVKVLKEAQLLEPKLYDGNVITKTSAIMIPDSEETLMLTEESRSKMFLKQKDPTMLEKKVNITPVDYADNSVSNQSAPSFDHYFELNELKAQSQEKDTVISKLKERIKSLSGHMKEDKIKMELKEIEIINIELDHKVSKLIVENEHSKQTYKQLYDLIKSTRVKSSTRASGSQHSGNTKKAKIQRPPSSTQKNKVEAHHMIVKTSLKNNNRIVEPKGTASVHHSTLNANSKLIRVKCNGCMLLDNHDLITTTAEVPFRKPIAVETDTPKPVVTLVYSKKPRKSKSTDLVSKSKVVQIVLWYLDSGCSKHMTGDHSQLTNFVNKFLGTVKFRNDHVAKIMGYGDYLIENVNISRVYYVEGHNLLSVGQFCNSDLEVAFHQHTCFIRNLDGVDLLT
nr:integrase, catalytic region, zinc finger, CCHC-type, peptidase aspartic, catalytic [Tanacetum cinerariifolium]